jgi:hypothetical protein
MSDYRKGYVRFNGHESAVTWHAISKEVYAYWGTDRYAGKAYDMQEALDIEPCGKTLNGISNYHLSDTTENPWICLTRGADNNSGVVSG